MPKRPSSQYADEGTFAHALAEKCLEEGCFDASRYIGTEIKHPKLDSYKEVTKETAVAVQVYLDVIEEELGRSEDAVLQIEQSFELPLPSADPGEVYGANDALVYHPSTRRLAVFDYKHGAGVSVSVEDNAQLKFYAAGAALTSGWSISELELFIVQPRARDAEDQDIPGVKPWKMDTFELIEFVAEVDAAVALAKTADAQPYLDAREDSLSLDGFLATGSHCRWCDAASVCPAQKEAIVEQIGVDFMGVDFTAAALPEPQTLDIEELARTLVGLDLLDTWSKQVREFAFGLMESGVDIPGRKLVEKTARRKWIDDEKDIAAFLELQHGIPADDAFPRKIVTITEAERLIKQRVTDKAERKAALDDMSLRYTLKESSGHTMVPDDSPRQAVTAGPSADFADFAGVNL